MVGTKLNNKSNKAKEYIYVKLEKIYFYQLIL